MKMIYGGVPVNSLKVRHYETSTYDATVSPLDVQVGLTYYANGRKEVGTGKSLEFASYGQFATNQSDFVPSNIKVIHISSTEVPIQLTTEILEMKNQDFANPFEIGMALVNNVKYPILVQDSDHIISITCEQTINLEVFFGKDNYI